MAALRVVTALVATLLVSATCHVMPKYPVVRDGELCSEWQRCLPPYFCDLSYSASGSSGVGRCRLPPTAGLRCSNQENTCEEPTTCVSGYCRTEVPIGGECNDERISGCIPPLKCRGPELNRRCETPLGLGHRCDGSYLFCTGSLKCVEYGETRRCVNVAAESFAACGDALTVCGEGFQCVTENNQSKCRPTLNKGNTCNPPTAMCAKGQVCVENKCRVLAGLYAGCGDGYTQCEDGLECRGSAGNSVCMRASNTCNVTSISSGQLTIASNASNSTSIALPKRGELCSALDGTCAENHICLGSGTLAKCHLVQKPYGFCHWGSTVCQNGWECRGSKTSKICVQTVGLGKGCDNAYFFCKPDLQCIEWGSSRRCVKFVPPSGNCTNTFELCDGGYKCTDSNSTQGKVCVENKPNLPDSQLPATNQACKQPEEWCQTKNVCVGPTNSSKCVGTLKENELCNVKNAICESGTACRGKDVKKCRRAMKRGKGCNEELVCEDGLTCMLWGSGDRCVAFLEKGGDCLGSHKLCGPGLSCQWGENNTRTCQ